MTDNPTAQSQHLEPPADRPPDRPQLYVASSPIHGLGVFAANRIPADALIGSYLGVPTEEDGTYVLWLSDDDESWYGIEGTGLLRYLNHAGRPNAEFYGADLYALRDIEPGEEITFHYGDDWAGVDDGDPAASQ